MKRSKLVGILGLLCLIIGGIGSGPAFGVPVSIQPPNTVVGPGQSFSIDVVIADLISLSDLFAFQFDLSFDPLVLAANGVTEGPFLASGGPTTFLPGLIDNAAGAITFVAGTLQGAVPGVTGGGTLATVDFTALALGTSPITLSNVILLNSELGDITAAVESGAATVVPEPATVLLLGSGALVWGVVHRRRRQPAA